MILSLDIEKAFDQIEHKYLFYMLDYMAFGQIFLQTIQQFIEFQRLTFLLMVLPLTALLLAVEPGKDAQSSPFSLN